MNTWYVANTGNHQGLVIGETGENIAVTYDKANARLIAKAPEMLALLQEMQQDVQDTGAVAMDTVMKGQRLLASLDTRPITC